MTTEHPITPPLELVKQWAKSMPLQHSDEWWGYELLIAHHAARWGADQELEACCEWCADGSLTLAQELRTARRPKPPSLAEQAMEALEKEDDSMPLMSLQRSDRFELIRRALERLKELEKGNE